MKKDQWLLIYQINYTYCRLDKLFDEILEKQDKATKYELVKVKETFQTLDRLYALFFNTKPNIFLKWWVARRHKQTIRYIKRVEELESMVE